VVAILLRQTKAAIIDYAQHESPSWIGGHFTSPYEQYTQQSPAFGLSTTSHFLQS
jgi:hypothetical protein